MHKKKNIIQLHMGGGGRECKVGPAQLPPVLARPPPVPARLPLLYRPASCPPPGLR
jgi:hypothetical protein